MSYNNNMIRHAAYKAAQYNVSKTRQVVMLYDGAMRFIKKAIQSIQDKDIQERYNNLEKAGKIIMGLQASLDFDKGGDISKILDQYYHGIDMRIILAQRTNDIAALEQVNKEIGMMRDAWDEVDKMSSTAVPDGSDTNDHSAMQDMKAKNDLCNDDKNHGSLSLDI